MMIMLPPASQLARYADVLGMEGTRNDIMIKNGHLNLFFHHMFVIFYDAG
jgi:hypothetical protein